MSKYLDYLTGYQEDISRARGLNPNMGIASNFIQRMAVNDNALQQGLSLLRNNPKLNFQQITQIENELQSKVGEERRKMFESAQSLDAQRQLQLSAENKQVGLQISQEKARMNAEKKAKRNALIQSLSTIGGAGIGLIFGMPGLGAAAGQLASGIYSKDPTQMIDASQSIVSGIGTINKRQTSREAASAISEALPKLQGLDNTQMTSFYNGLQLTDPRDYRNYVNNFFANNQNNNLTEVPEINLDELSPEVLQAIQGLNRNINNNGFPGQAFNNLINWGF